MSPCSSHHRFSVLFYLPFFDLVYILYTTSSVSHVAYYLSSILSDTCRLYN